VQEAAAQPPAGVEDMDPAVRRLLDPAARTAAWLGDVVRHRCLALPEGSATVEGLPAGEWNVQVVAANGATWQGVVVSTGAPLTEVEIQ